MQNTNQEENIIPIIKIISPTQVRTNNITQISGTPQTKRNYSARSSSASSDGSDVARPEHKRGKINIEDTFIDIDTQEAVFLMGNDDADETVVIKVSVLQDILSNLADLRNKFDQITKSQEKVNLALLGQDIKSDRILTKLVEIKEDLKAEKILNKIVDIHTRTPRITTVTSSNTNVTSSNTQATTTPTASVVQTPPVDNTIHVPTWKSKFHKRRMCYKQAYYNGVKSKILKKHLDSTTPYILKKHRPKMAYNSEDYTDRLEVSKALQLQESRSLMNSSKKHYSTIAEIDRDINASINKAPINSQQKEDLRNKWKSEVTTSKPNSEKLVASSITYMENLPNTVPFTGFSELKKAPNGTYQIPRGQQRDPDNQHYQRQGYRNTYRRFYNGDNRADHRRGKNLNSPRHNDSNTGNWREPSRVFTNSTNHPFRQRT